MPAKFDATEPPSSPVKTDKAGCSRREPMLHGRRECGAMVVRISAHWRQMAGFAATTLGCALTILLSLNCVNEGIVLGASVAEQRTTDAGVNVSQDNAIVHSDIEPQQNRTPISSDEWPWSAVGRINIAITTREASVPERWSAHEPSLRRRIV